VLIALTGFAALAAVSACGPDLSKADFPRTTVSAKPVSTAPVPDDPALAFPAQRLVDACALLGKDALASLGTAATPSAFDFGTCSNDVTDPGGKKVHIRLELGDLVLADTDTATGTVEGVPEIVRKQTDGGCASTAVTTGGASSRGVTATATYEGAGDPCPAAHTVLDNAIKALKSNPPKLADAATPGSLIPVDPCASVDAGVASDVSNKGAASPVGLHSCAWGDSLTMRFDYTVSPSETDGFKSIDLGGGTPAFEKTPATNPGCEIKWQHRATQEGQGELVDISFNDNSVDAPKVDHCPQVLTFAKSVLSKLPKA
jgi:hypothetical protein